MKAYDTSKVNRIALMLFEEVQHILTKEFIEHLTPHSLEKQGHERGLRAENLICRDDVKCRNILSKYC